MTQEYGKVLEKEEAEKEFGLVTFSLEVKSSEVRNLISESPGNIMFKFVDNNLIVLNKNRQTIYGTFTAKSSDVFRNISTTVLSDLLVRGGQETTQFQMRGEIFSIENGLTVLEMTQPCPPFC
ncbi:MAG: hypothetical protein A2068_02155 [Ignavibacteria bacterium GWB2_35_6b]|nr:MAG: hypothetical protein A2068_02155 [Ignavibacteria bacterium GWB2_35_6b]